MAERAGADRGGAGAGGAREVRHVGGRGRNDAQRMVANLWAADCSEIAVRERLKEFGYSAARVSQLVRNFYDAHAPDPEPAGLYDGAGGCNPSDGEAAGAGGDGAAGGAAGAADPSAVPVADEMPAHGDDVELAAPPPRKREKFSDAEEDGAPENNDPVEMNGAETSTAS